MMRVQKVKNGVVSMLITGLALMLLAACSNKNKIPSGIMGREEMESVMWDMILADRYAAISFPNDSIKKYHIKDETLKTYDQVFQIHQISKDEFLKSYKFYLSRPDILKTVFDSIATKADRRKREDFEKPAEKLNDFKTAPKSPSDTAILPGTKAPHQLKGIIDRNELKMPDSATVLPRNKKGKRQYRRPA